MRVFNPLSQTYHNTSLTQCFRRNELEKRRAYDERIREIELGSFSPLVFSTTGSMGPTAATVYKRLAAIIAEKNNKLYSKTIHWLRCRLSFSLINPRRACADRATVVVSCVCLSVCLYVCLSKHAILVVCAVRSITKDAIVLSVRFAAILKRRFS